MPRRTNSAKTSSVAAENQQRPRVDLETIPGAAAGGVVRFGIAADDRLPFVTEFVRHGEGERLVMGVEQQQEGPALDRIAVAIVAGDLIAVEENSERVRVVALPVAVAHLLTVAAKPDHIGQAGALGLADKEVAAAKHRLCAS